MKRVNRVNRVNRGKLKNFWFISYSSISQLSRACSLLLTLESMRKNAHACVRVCLGACRIYTISSNTMLNSRIHNHSIAFKHRACMHSHVFCTCVRFTRNMYTILREPHGKWKNMLRSSTRKKKELPILRI